ncbi:MAG: PTS sugar transporter subunit IIA [Kiritimatiellia bacterium]|jgi:mannitol/fructose-specific phosphotransferase system IIA component (Ntr-type)|nr:PTS sugar transporter subunit IIA [Kiritimatiellia bacterium]MDP6809120.1 PTS sugar transporter subunit IIA [Kiritimatiellia bacterium]MDP7023188.1 PTS sugar transporter subunit IIA [Kiritimatiellia bacterium]
MHPVVNQLIQLEELILIRDEQKLMSGEAHLENLNAAIKAMTGKLPRDVREHAEKLGNKQQSAIVPIAVQVCSGCGMSLPISLVQAVRLAREVHNCPNCARMLYFVESAAKRIANKRRRTGRQKGGIARFSSPSLMIPKLTSTTVEEVIEEMASKMEAEGFVEGSDKLVEAALQREAIVSTAVGHGLAVPHVRGVEGGGLALAVGLSSKGIRWDGDQEELTRIVVFIVIPTAASAFYLKLLAGLAETFSDTEARSAFLAEKDADGMWKSLAKLTRKTVK